MLTRLLSRITTTQTDEALLAARPGRLGCTSKAAVSKAPASRRSGALLSLAAAVAGASSGGCTTVWERNFDGAAMPPPISAADVRVREVPWERIDAALAELRQRLIASDVPYDEWTPEQKAAAKVTLLRGLQVTQDPARVDVLGSSQFRSTDPLRPQDGELASFAGRIGANLVVWSSRFVGKGDRVVTEPVTTFGSVGYPRWDPISGDRWQAWGGTATTWVPVVVLADEYAWSAFFLRTP
ncbi:MAG TPA: hypothetical protein PKC43_05400 [Phycisphaerales bacterium]|nr:hypothetical protein [Phycisphaerales bacterium]HMP36867.1 hypothetical protein [Phycisphaerales bacterium]